MPTDLAKVYAPSDVEERWATRWRDAGLFRADPAASGEAFSIVIPPPNITGRLHFGHALNNALQDVLIRYRKMGGFNTLWVPGTDHASIATQNVVERQLADEGTDRHAVGRERFLERTFAWKEEVGGYITAQLQRLGAGCDWSRERFTMDEGLSRAVDEVRTGLDEYRFNDVATALYRFFWNEYCDWYVELAKLSLSGSDPVARRGAQSTLLSVLEEALRLLHPVMPFLTDELWHALPLAGGAPTSVVELPFPERRAVSPEEELQAESCERLIAMVQALRSLRAEFNIPPSQPIDLLVVPRAAAWNPEHEPAIRRLAKVGNLSLHGERERPRGRAVIPVAGVELYVELAGLIDVAAERERLSREVERVVAELAGVRKKLDNEDFVARAPEEIVATARGRAEDLAAKRDLLERGLGRLAEVGA